MARREKKWDFYKVNLGRQNMKNTEILLCWGNPEKWRSKKLSKY